MNFVSTDDLLSDPTAVYAGTLNAVQIADLSGRLEKLVEIPIFSLRIPPISALTS